MNRDKAKTRRVRILVPLAAIALVSTFFVRYSQDPATPTAVEHQESVTSQGTARQAPVGKDAAQHTETAALLSGRVVTTDGAGVSARVCAWELKQEVVLGFGANPRGASRHCVEAQPDGSFAIDHLLPRWYRVEASAPGFLPAVLRDDMGQPTSLDLTVHPVAQSLELVLSTGGVGIEGRVFDVGGGPIAGATVTAESQIGARAHAATDADGRFALTVVKGFVILRASAPGYSPETTSSVTPHRDIRMHLSPGSTVVGRVVDATTGDPVPGAQVHSNAGAVPALASFQNTATYVTTRADADGRFRLSGLAPGRYKPRAITEGAAGTAARSLRVGLGERVEGIRISVVPAPSIQGRVAFDEPGSACRATPAQVSLFNSRNGLPQHRMADAEGTVRFEGVVPDTYTVAIHCPGFVPAASFAPIVVTTEKEVPPATWLMKAGAALRGQVRDAQRHPVAGAQVFAKGRGENPRHRGGWDMSSTDASGRFVLSSLPAGVYDIEARAEGYVSARLEQVEVEERVSHQPLTLILGAGGTLAGRVIDRTGSPVPEVLVHARNPGVRFFRRPTLTDINGAFEIAGLSPGSYKVQAGDLDDVFGRKNPDDNSTPNQARVTVTAERTETITLVVDGPAGTIAGQVVDANQAPIPDVFVVAHRETDIPGMGRKGFGFLPTSGGSRKPRLTDAGGRFELTGLRPGTYGLVAYRKGGGEAVRRGVSLGSDVTLILHNGGTLAGKVLFGEEAAAPFSITVSNGDTGFTRTEDYHHTSGQWSVTDVPAGTVTVSAAAREGTAHVEIDLEAGETRSDLLLKLKHRATLRGVLRALDGSAPVVGFFVHASPVNDNGEPPALIGGGDVDRKFISDADGHFELEGVPAGPLAVMAAPGPMSAEGSFAFVQTVVDTQPGEVTEVEIKVPRLRVPMGQEPAALGFDVTHPSLGTDFRAAELVIKSVDADGPATNKLKAGDVIVSVDGYDVRGAHAFRFGPLSRVPPGTTLRLGLKGGAEVTLATRDEGSQ